MNMLTTYLDVWAVSDVSVSANPVIQIAPDYIDPSGDSYSSAKEVEFLV